MADDKGKSETVEIRGITDEEMVVAFSGPAPLANRFFITIGSSGARIAFAEQVGEKVPPAFRTAVLLPFPDAQSLVEILGALLKRSVKFEVIEKKADQEKTDG